MKGFEEPSPLEISSREFSIFAVNFLFTRLVKCCSNNWVTASPKNVGINFPLLRSTYPLLTIVPIIDANVEGRPIPFSSSDLTRDASVYLAGGLVLCSSECRDVQFNSSPFFIGGRTLSLFSKSFSGLSRPSTYALI